MASVSVIIPAYKAAQTLRRAVESVIKQTFPDIEIIIVDDGSPDNTKAVAESLAAEDSRIRVLCQSNQGCYMARLAGFLAAQGRYIMTVDADDFIEPDMVAEMIGFAEDTGVDVVECDFFNSQAPSGKREIYPTREEVQQKIVYPKLVKGVGYMCVWGKLYRNNINWKAFEKCRITSFEDIIFNAQIMSKVNSYGILHRPLYHYEINSGSSVCVFKIDRIKGLLNAIAIRRKYGISDIYWNIKNISNVIKLAIRSLIK